MLPTLRLTLYSKDNCPLCDEALASIHEVLGEEEVALEVIDISQDPALMQTYGTEIPVLWAGTLELARHRITARRLRRVLSQHQSHPG